LLSAYVHNSAKEYILFHFIHVENGDLERSNNLPKVIARTRGLWQPWEIFDLHLAGRQSSWALEISCLILGERNYRRA
jgi:hypothetical protein